MDSILSYYTVDQLKTFIKMDTNEWPDTFKNWININLSNKFHKNYAQNSTDNTYLKQVSELIEAVSYGF